MAIATPHRVERIKSTWGRPGPSPLAYRPSQASGEGERFPNPCRPGCERRVRVCLILNRCSGGSIGGRFPRSAGCSGEGAGCREPGLGNAFWEGSTEEGSRRLKSGVESGIFRSHERIRNATAICACFDGNPPDMRGVRQDDRRLRGKDVWTRENRLDREKVVYAVGKSFVRAGYAGAWGIRRAFRPFPLESLPKRLAQPPFPLESLPKRLAQPPFPLESLPKRLAQPPFPLECFRWNRYPNGSRGHRLHCNRHPNGLFGHRLHCNRYPNGLFGHRLHCNHYPNGLFEHRLRGYRKIATNKLVLT
jgi:hypothetical protein